MEPMTTSPALRSAFIARHRRRLGSFLLALLAVAQLATLGGVRAAPAPPTFAGRVVGISDGDTIRILRERGKETEEITIHLHGIDCPEEGQPFGSAARKATAELVLDQLVTVIEYTDPDGRTTAEVVYGKDLKSLNEELVLQGMAWWFRQAAPGARKLEILEREARAGRRGLWRDEDPVPPWEWPRR